MSFSIHTVTEQQHTPATAQHIVQTAEVTMLMTAALAGASVSKAARKQYRKIARKAALVLAGYKIKRLLGFKKQSADVPDEILGLNFWVFMGIVIVGAALGAWLFGFLGFIILVALAFIIFLLVKDDL